MSSASPDLAAFVFHRAQRSIYLLEGLHHALEDLGRPDLVAVLHLVQEDASQAQAAAQRSLQARARRKTLRIMVDLQHLARIGGAKAHHLAVRVARSLGA